MRQLTSDESLENLLTVWQS